MNSKILKKNTIFIELNNTSTGNGNPAETLLIKN